MSKYFKAIGKEVLFLLAAIVSFTIGYMANGILYGVLSLIALSLLGSMIGKKLAKNKASD